MRGDRLNSILSKMYRSGTADLRNKKTLEADLLSRYRKLHSQNRRWLMLLNPWNRIARFVLTGLALCVVVIGACTTETTTEVEVGKQLKMDLAAAGEGDEAVEGQFVFIYQFKSQDDMARESKKLSKLLILQPGVEDANVSISQQSTGETSVDILVWGAGLDADELVASLKDTYPDLANASITVNDLNTTIKESYASKIGRKVFKVEGSGTDPESLRQQFLEQLAAQGFDGHADINVETDGDQQTITIEMEEEE